MDNAMRGCFFHSEFTGNMLEARISLCYNINLR